MIIRRPVRRRPVRRRPVRHSPVRHSPARRGLATLVALACALTVGTGLAHATEDPDLDQQIDPGQDVAADAVVRDAGHIDIGPKLVDGEWTLMIHDDTDVAGSVWRTAEQTVFKVNDAAVLEVPDNEAYSFIGVPPGSPVHVVPQTQAPDVVWIGWNTQDPEVMSLIDRGVTMSLAAVQGPGDLVVYLQDGGFGEPDVLWDSRSTDPQPLWVDVNTHTHADWVFTEPGTYLAQIQVEADLIDGTTVSDTQAVRFSVGDASDPEEAFAAEPVAVDAQDQQADDAAADDDSGSIAPMLIGAAVVAAVLLALVLWLVARDRAARRAALGDDE